MESQKDILIKNLKDRIRLLSRGILPPLFNGKPLVSFVGPGVGAGPQGKIFHIYSQKDKTSMSMISVPIYPEDHHLAEYALTTKLGDIPGTLITEDGITLKSCLIPKFHNISFKDFPIIPIMMHCYRTCTTVLGFGCKHYDTQEECKYCEIEPVGRNIINLPKKHSIKTLIKAIEIAIEQDNIRSFTITSGTFDKPDEVAKEYIKLLTKLKEKTKISIHIQIEPVSDLDLIKQLAELSDNIGIFLEIFDEKIRREICPGKAKISKKDYIKNWETAVKYFGRGNVLTSCLLGFGVKYDDILKNIEDFAQIGVCTSLLFIRSKSESLKNFIPTFLKRDEKDLIDLHIEAAKILSKYDIAYKKGIGAGCIGCQGCTAMMEACELSDFLLLPG